MGRLESAGYLLHQCHRLVHGKLFLPIETVAKRVTLHVRHHVEEEAVGRARVEQRQDVRVLQVGGGLDLGEETLGAHDRRELGLQDLDGHPAAVLEILGQVYRGHAAFAQGALEAVSVGQGRRQAGGQVRHGRQ
jgi:hypothetical protein